MGSFEEGERTQSVSQGEGAVIPAPRIRSFPQPQVTWFRDGRKIPPSSRMWVFFSCCFSGFLFVGPFVSYLVFLFDSRNTFWGFFFRFPFFFPLSLKVFEGFSLRAAVPTCCLFFILLDFVLKDSLNFFYRTRAEDKTVSALCVQWNISRLTHFFFQFCKKTLFYFLIYVFFLMLPIVCLYFVVFVVFVCQPTAKSRSDRAMEHWASWQPICFAVSFWSLKKVECTYEGRFFFLKCFLHFNVLCGPRKKQIQTLLFYY